MPETPYARCGFARLPRHPAPTHPPARAPPPATPPTRSAAPAPRSCDKCDNTYAQQRVVLREKGVYAFSAPCWLNK